MTYFNLIAGNTAVLAGISTAPSSVFLQCSGVCRAESSLFLFLSFISVSVSGVFDIFGREKNSLNSKRNAWEYIAIWFSSYCKEPSVQWPKDGQVRTQALLEGCTRSLLLMKRWQATPSLHEELAFSFFCYFRPQLKMG